MKQLPGFTYEGRRKRAVLDGYVAGTNHLLRYFGDDELMTITSIRVNEAEHEWIRMMPSSDHRVSMIPRFALSHRDARLVTGWFAAALDSRLARGARWDSVLDAARIDRTGAERGAVVFDPLRFTVWWTSLAN